MARSVASSLTEAMDALQLGQLGALLETRLLQAGQLISAISDLKLINDWLIIPYGIKLDNICGVQRQGKTT